MFGFFFFTEEHGTIAVMLSGLMNLGTSVCYLESKDRERCRLSSSRERSNATLTSEPRSSKMFIV